MPPHSVNQDRVQSFPTEAAFEEWLSANHATQKEVWIRIYKTGSSVPTITPVQAIDVALCWGWIDGVRKALDDTSFLQRYTPRKAKTNWSQINRDNVARLTAAGRMTAHGQRHIDAALADGRLTAAYAPVRNTTEATLPADSRAALEKRPAPAKAQPHEGKVAPKAPAPAKAQPAAPAKAQAAAPKGSARAKAKAKAKPAKGRAAAPRRPAKATRAAKTSAASKPPRKAKSKKATAPASKKKGSKKKAKAKRK